MGVSSDEMAKYFSDDWFWKDNFPIKPVGRYHCLKFYLYSKHIFMQLYMWKRTHESRSFLMCFYDLWIRICTIAKNRRSISIYHNMNSTWRFVLVFEVSFSGPHYLLFWPFSPKRAVFILSNLLYSWWVKCPYGLYIGRKR